MKRLNEVSLYLIMGVLTTIVNISIFFFLIHLHMDYKLATTIAWIISILFAYITNKKYVFKSTTNTKRALFKEMLSFFWFRFLSYFIDLGSMILLIGFLNSNETFAKLVANIMVVIVNYGFSKWIVFKDHDQKRKVDHPLKTPNNQ